MSVEVTLDARSQGARGILLQEPRGALPGRGGGAVLGQRLDGEHLRLEPEPGPREALAILREQREGTRRVLLLERGFDPGDMGELLAEARCLAGGGALGSARARLDAILCRRPRRVL